MICVSWPDFHWPIVTQGNDHMVEIWSDYCGVGWCRIFVVHHTQLKELKECFKVRQEKISKKVRRFHLKMSPSIHFPWWIKWEVIKYFQEEVILIFRSVSRGHCHLSKGWHCKYETATEPSRNKTLNPKICRKNHSDCSRPEIIDRTTMGTEHISFVKAIAID